MEELGVCEPFRMLFHVGTVCRNGQSPILIHRRRCRGKFESGTASSIGARAFRELSDYSRLEASLTSAAACR